jgi:hypothetical protein
VYAGTGFLLIQLRHDLFQQHDLRQVIMVMLNNTMNVPVIVTVFFIYENFIELTFGQLFYLTDKRIRIGPEFIQ